MDPNATLLAYLEARAEADEAANKGDRDMVISFEGDALDAADNLFTWLSNGGFQPDWAAVATNFNARH